MTKKHVLLIAFVALILAGEARPGVVGLQTTNSSLDPFGAITDGSNKNTLVNINFSTKANGGGKLTDISFANLNIASGSNALTAKLYEGGNLVATTSLNFLQSGQLISLGTLSGNVGAYNLVGDRNYKLTILAFGELLGYTSTDGLVTNSMLDKVVDGSQSQDGGGPSGLNAYGADFTLYTAIPEPGTMILTGSALGAGTVFGFFKRRRRSEDALID